MTEMQGIQEAGNGGRRRRGSSILIAVLVAVVSMVFAAPASAAPTVVSESASQISASDATLEARSQRSPQKT
jgi:hypothetical protein